MPTGTGRIIIPSQQDLQWHSLALQDRGTRPVLRLTVKSAKIDVTYDLFPNATDSSSPELCRDNALDAVIHHISPIPGYSDIQQIRKTEHAPVSGRPLAIASFFVATEDGTRVEQLNLLGISSSATACAEIRIAKSKFKPDDQSNMSAQLEAFVFEPDYKPSPQDYYNLGTIFYTVNKSYESAALYYQRALDTLPNNSALNTRRVVTDQLAMSYGLGGQIKESRAINEAAIKTDSAYPLYYYNLACADAQDGNANDAKLHLQQAFDRKANTLPGEHLPDPTQDDSILKLKKNKDFWAFVQTLK
jgi:tetratricopeptide (TPR) repeat protein